MDIKNREFVSSRIFSARIANFISLVAIITVTACIIRAVGLFYQVIFTAHYASAFTIALSIVLSSFCLMWYVFVSSFLSRIDGLNLFERLLDLFEMKKNLETISQKITDVGLLILDKMDEMGVDAVRNNRAAMPSDSILAAKSLSSALYLLNAISDKLSSIDNDDYYASANALPDYVLNKAIRFCDFKSLSLDLVSDNGIGSCLTISYCDKSGSCKEIYLRGESVNALAGEILSMKSCIVNCEYKIKKTSSEDYGTPTSAVIGIQKKQIFLKIL